jgi:hypothetical protein
MAPIVAATSEALRFSVSGAISDDDVRSCGLPLQKIPTYPTLTLTLTLPPISDDGTLQASAQHLLENLTRLAAAEPRPYRPLS